jgi:predicted hotdog family 3-hydroxylacyl-ACP dehydratase
MLNAQQLRDRLPHDGDMCLLQRVLAWDRDSLVCIATSHRDPGNPLRNEQGLPAVAGAEYAAQAMAIHAGLVNDDTGPRRGFLAALRNLVLEVDRLHHQTADLSIEVRRMGADRRGAIYDFQLRADVGST